MSEDPRHSKKLRLALILVSAACLVLLALTVFLWISSRSNDKPFQRANGERQSTEQIFFSGHKSKAPTPWPPPIANEMEFTEQLVENFPEKVDHKQGWMDGTFIEINNYPIESYMNSIYTSVSVAFAMEDKDGRTYNFCLADKEKFGKFLLALHRDDRIRVTGQALSMGTSVMWIKVDSIQVVK